MTSFPPTPGPGAQGGAEGEFERFLYAVSHDLKGPIHTIRGFVELVLQDLNAGRLDTLREDLTRVSEASTLLQTQLDALLALSRIGRRGVSQASLPAEVLQAELLRLWDGTLRSVGGSWSFDLQVPALHTDPALLLDLLGHLIGNSVAFRSPERALHVQISLLRHDDWLELIVADNGIGVEASQLERIFELFRRGHPDHQGLGVGLTLARRIASLLGGSLHAKGPVGDDTGLAVILRLPMP